MENPQIGYLSRNAAFVLWSVKKIQRALYWSMIAGINAAFLRFWNVIDKFVDILKLYS